MCNDSGIRSILLLFYSILRDILDFYKIFDKCCYNTKNYQDRKKNSLAFMHKISYVLFRRLVLKHWPQHKCT